MSRIGKKPVSFPASVKLSIAGDGQVSVTGPKGSLSWQLPKGVTASVEN
jgi:large subunit ribosomal protein L6